MTNKITEDPRIDPRIKEQFKDINFPEVLVESSSREEMLAKVNTEEGQVELMMYEAVFNDPRLDDAISCLLYTSPSPRDRTRSRMPSSA